MNCDLYCEDNLVTLNRLENESIDLIYCDVLYGTGKKFVDYADLQPNRQTIFDFYNVRLIEMFRVLKNTGTIYLQCDIRINHWLRMMMDDIFGYENFRNEIIKLAQGSTRYNMSKIQLMKIEIGLPCLKEQTLIANFLSSIDEKINHTQTEITKTEVWKKGLLQKMFV